LPLTWGGKDSQNVLWKSPLVGQGHASPIVWGRHVIVCTAHWPPEVTQREKVIPEHHVLCYDAADGRLLWDAKVPPGPWLRTDFRSGPGGGYACPTPTTDGKLIFCVFGSSVVAALDFQGKLVWRKEIIPHTFDVTIGSSPVLYEDTLLMLCAMARKEDSKLIAFDKATGEVRWQKAFPQMGFGHSTPVLATLGGRRELLITASGGSPSAEALLAVDPATGERLWWCAGAGETASPAVGAGIIYFDCGRGGPGVALQPRGPGDRSADIRWRIDPVPEALSSPVIVGEHVYRLLGSGVLKCWRVSDGQQVYAARLDGIATTWASPIVDPQGRIFFASAGKSYVIQAGPQFTVLATTDLGDGNHPSPAAAGGRMFLVGQKYLWCIGRK
jgi:outer membrane protein assembly factor BamB